MTTPATVVLVHGAWHGAWCWAGLQAELDRRGVPSLAVDLPGHGTSLLPLGDLHGDGRLVADTLARIAGPVVLVGHSYGGAVIGEAATYRPADVVHLVYLTAFCLDEGEAVLPLAQDFPPVPLNGAIRPTDDGTSTVDPDLCVECFYHRCPPGVAEAAIARLGRQPLATFVQPATGAPWRTTPSTYVRCTEDRAIHVDGQDRMATRCGTVLTLETDHSPFASMPAETADILAVIARS